MACLTFSASSFDISRPALTVYAAGRGSSVVTTALDECVETVVDIVVARAVGRPSAVRNNDLAAWRSCIRHIVVSEPSTFFFLVLRVSTMRTLSRILW